jgi:serine/threonine protein phosphatase PrpC
LQVLGVADGHGGDVVSGLLEGTCLKMLLPEGAQKKC